MKGFLLTYVLAYGGAALALFNPFVGVAIYWIFDIVRPQYMFAWSGLEGAFSYVVAVGTIVGWAAKGFGNWRFGRARLLVVLFLGYWVLSLLSALDASNQEVARSFIVVQSKRTLMFVIALTLADSASRVRQLAWVVALSAGYLCYELNMRYFAGMNEVHVIGYGGMDNNCIAISLITCLPVAVFLGLQSRTYPQKVLAWGAALFIGHGVLLTFSRGGMLGMIVATATAVAVMPKRPRYVGAVLIAVVLAFRLAGPEVRGRFMTSFAEAEVRDASAQSRVELWMDCLKVIERYPLLGAGPDHFPLLASEFGWPEGKEAHSLWFQIGAELGMPAMIALLLFYAAAVWRMWPLARVRGETDVQRWGQYAACMVVSSLTGFAVAAQFVTLEGLETPLYVVAIAAGTLRLPRQETASTVAVEYETMSTVHGVLRHPRLSGDNAVAHE